MIEDQYYTSTPSEPRPLVKRLQKKNVNPSVVNLGERFRIDFLIERRDCFRSSRNFKNTTLDNGCDFNPFNKYDPYVEKIRTLFVPSLEPRIYSCLETFVYREERDALSVSPCLKRCLNMAATWREPLDGFSIGFGSPGFFENMLAHAIKYVIKDGLIDCFLNSIVLNNRLSKVCRNLDAVGVERDFLRCLAVWNYINERDYWIDDDRQISISTSNSSHGSIDSCSDLDVEIGSGVDTFRSDGCEKRAETRRTIYDSSEMVFEDPDEFLENRKNRLEFPSRLSIDSSNAEGSISSSVRKNPRPISQTQNCRPFNCPVYGTKNSHRRWEGKSLKLRISKICPSTSQCESVKPLRLTKLPLPCKFHDLIAEIVEVDLSVPRLSSIKTRRNFRAGVVNVCRCVNETLEKMSANEVRRCRLHCEILPDSISFKLMQRESNGYKICLFTDRVTTDNIDGQMALRGSSFSRTAENTKPNESDLPICESARVYLPDENSKTVTTRITSSHRLLESKLDGTDQRDANDIGPTSNLGQSHFNDLTCDCSPFVDESKNLDHDERENLENSRLDDSETVEKTGSADPSGNGIDDQTCQCENYDHNLDIFSRQSKNLRDVNPADGFESKSTASLGKKLAPEDSSNRLSRNKTEDQNCHCENSEDNNLDIFMRDTEGTRHSSHADDLEVKNIRSDELTLEDSLNHLGGNKTDDETCFCNSVPEKLNVDPKTENNQESRTFHSSTFISDTQQKSCEGTEKTDVGVENNQQVLASQLNLQDSWSELETANRIETEIQLNDINCECPESCECINKSNVKNDLEQCDSQCFCDSCGAPKKETSTKCFNTDTKVSRLSNPEESYKIQPTEIICECPESCECIKKCDKKMHQISKPKSKTSFNFPETKTNDILPTRENQKLANIRTEYPNYFPPKESRLKSSMAQTPISINTERASSARSHRINISIELCPDSQSSSSSLKNRRETITSLWQNEAIQLRHDRDFPSTRRNRCAIAEKNTKDECLEHLRRLNATPHSSPRPLESRDYLPPPLTSSLGMRNPNVCGMSTKSLRSTCKFERRSTRRSGRRKNGSSTFSKLNESCEKIQKNLQHGSADPDGSLRFSRPTSTRQGNSSSVPQNLCHAFSASSVDRMRHLIKTKLRRILLERDKSTNTPKTTLTNDRYRVSVPNEKMRGSPIVGQRCHTIWESRSASDSCTSRTFGCGSFGVVSRGDEVRSLFRAKTNSKISSSQSKHLEGTLDSNVDRCNCLKNSSESLLSSGLAMESRRLFGGSDAHRNRVDCHFENFWMQRQKCGKKITSKTVETKFVTNSCDDESSSKNVNPRCKGDSEVVAKATIKLSNLGDDCNAEKCQNGRQEDFIKYPRRLDWSGNSTSRHIYLHEYENLESSNDDDDKNWSPRLCTKNRSTLQFSKPVRLSEKNSSKVRNKNRTSYKKSSSHRSDRRFSPEPKIATGNIRPPSQKGLTKLDQDLRAKLLQYVSLCKNVKYSLLRMLRPDEVYEVSGTSGGRCDRYKCGDP